MNPLLQAGTATDGRAGSTRPLSALVAFLAGLALLAACGSSSSAGGSPRSPHHAGYQQYHAYSKCMRSHGAPFWPEPSAVAYGVFDSPYAYTVNARILAQEHGSGWNAALRSCRALAPAALPFTAAQISTLRSQLEKLAACMRAHGITHFPSPVVNSSGGGFPSLGTDVNTDSAQFLAAQRACWADAPPS
jgi:hypothetical protein